MELNKENMRKIRELILFTALLIVVLWNMKRCWRYWDMWDI